MRPKHRRDRAHARRTASRRTRARRKPSQSNPFAATLGSIFGNSFGAQANQQAQTPQPTAQPAPPHESERIRTEARADIERGFYDVRLIEIEVEETPNLPMGMMGGGDERFRAWVGGAGAMGEMLLRALAEEQ